MTVFYNLDVNPTIASGSGATGAITATIAGITGKMAYITGWDYSIVGGTANTTITLPSLAGPTSTVSVTVTYQVAGAATGASYGRQYADVPLQCFSEGTAVTISASANTAATTCAIALYGFYG